MVERLPCKQEASGSKPEFSTSYPLGTMGSAVGADDAGAVTANRVKFVYNLKGFGMERFRKLIGTIVGGILGLGVGAVLTASGVILAPVLVALITVVLSAIGTYVAPANAPQI